MPCKISGKIYKIKIVIFLLLPNTPEEWNLPILCLFSVFLRKISAKCGDNPGLFDCCGRLLWIYLFTYFPLFCLKGLCVKAARSFRKKTATIDLILSINLTWTLKNNDSKAKPGAAGMAQCMSAHCSCTYVGMPQPLINSVPQYLAPSSDLHRH